MAELLPKERLQPSLLDRLTDDAPGELQESREKRVLSERQLRQGVLRDLGWLLSTANLESRELPETGLDDGRWVLDRADYPDVARSVVNYGTLPIAGSTLSGIETTLIEQKFRQAIQDFEPRLLPDSLKVRAMAASDRMSLNALNFVIEGDLWANPMPLHLYIKTELNIETGEARLQDTGG